MADIRELFGEGRLSYEEFQVKLSESGMEWGDTREMRLRHLSEMYALRKDTALERELDRAGVKNRDIVRRVIDMDRISVDEEGVHGIAEQLSSLRQSDPYLFGGREESSPRKVMQSGYSHSGRVIDPEALSDRDFYKQIKLM